MPLTSDLSKSPYFDDYDKSKQFAKMLFKPGVNIQTRELNQLQTLLQKQIEYFGDNVFVKGTIVDGCNFSFNLNYQYVKIVDIDTDFLTVNPLNYIGSLLINSTNGLKARIINAVDGFEATDPDLKTFYLSYMNTGTGGQKKFSSGDTLDITPFGSAIPRIKINNGGVGFSNNDTLVVTPSVVVDVANTEFTNGEFVVNSLGANLQIIGITYLTANTSVLRLKPRSADLANGTANSVSWTFSNNQPIRNVANTATANITKMIGSGLAGSFLTNDVGKILSTDVSNAGVNYDYLPTVTVRSVNNTTGTAALNLEPRSAITTITVAGTANAVGSGYAFAISEGVAYQKGYFLPVEAQTTIISKYSTTPNNVVVGFKTLERIIDSNLDRTLLDNALTSENENAPGADRLKLIPTLEVLDKAIADANTEFFTLVEWSEGQAFRQRPTSQYNKLGDEMALRTFEQSGNFVVDKFLVTTRSPMNVAFEANTVSVVVDPGVAYVSGYRTETKNNYVIDIKKGTDLSNTENRKVSLAYGNYIIINNIAGVFQFQTADDIDLYDTVKNANSTIAGVQTITSAGTKIGTARVRSMVADAAPGSFRLYLFDVKLSAGRNISQLKSIYYTNGTDKGVADVIRTDARITPTNPISGTDSRLLFFSGSISPAIINNISYTYRTIDTTTTIANTGIATKSLLSNPNELFAYSTTTLSASEQKSLYVVPLDSDLLSSNLITANVTCNTTTTTVTTPNTSMSSILTIGDYVYIQANSSTGQIALVKNIINSTSFTIESNGNFTTATASLYRAWPQNAPIPFGYRSPLTANVSANGNLLTLFLGERLRQTSSSRLAIACDITRSGVSANAKTANRKKYVKINIANNTGGTSGPWCIGVPDVFRLRNVYVAGNTSVTTSSNNVTQSFVIDHNQNLNYLDLSWLMLKPKTPYRPSSGDCLLVEFDYFTSSANSGFHTINSYVSANVAARYVTDSTPLANLTTSINTFEIPEVSDTTGNSYDLIQYLDFRPSVSATITPAANAASASINPSSTISFGNTVSAANDKKFPVPESIFSANVKHFMGRIDSILVNKNGKIKIVKGIPEETPNLQIATDTPKDSLKISDLIVPSYPNLPITTSSMIENLINTNVTNLKYLKKRFDAKTITRTFNYENKTTPEQPRVYTNSDIGEIDRRLRDVEYYVSLNLLESDLKNRVIPSSTDPTLDRFKYGFFVDDFSSYKYCERNDLQFAAYIENNKLVPEKMGWSMTVDVIIDTGKYIEYDILSQNNATVVPYSTTPPCIPNTKTANNFIFKAFSAYNDRHFSEYDSYKVVMAASETKPATLYFYAYDNYIKIEVYQGSTLIRSTADATNLSYTDKILTRNTQSWFNDSASVYMQDFETSEDMVRYAGKLVWTHNPTNGLTYTIKTYRGDGTVRWKELLEYPIDRDTVGCPVVPTPNTPPPQPPPPPEPTPIDHPDIDHDSCGVRDVGADADRGGW